MLSKVFSNKFINIKRIIIIILALGFFIFLYFFNQVNKVELTNQKGTSFDKAVVEEVVKDNIQKDGSRVGNQDVRVKMLSGAMKGKILNATSFSGYLYGADCKKNMKVIVSLSKSQNNYAASVYSYDREPILYGFVGLFILILWLIGGRKGFKSAIALIFTFICVIFLFIPMLYKGYSPFLAAVIVGILTTIVTMYLIAGLSVKTIASILGTVMGVVIAGIFATGFGYFAKISGYNVTEVEELVYLGAKAHLDVGGILFAGILIASLGAVMDVSISVASTINEIYDKNTELTSRELFASGINVGRDMMGTMSNTLILAFTGGAINTLILIYSYDMKYNQIVNMYSVGIEVMQGISGSIAVILTVPLVSFITSKLLKSKVIKDLYIGKI
ncbi:YibE/F family protein [Clostridium pasteurianum]|uniref:Putative multitransmembrane protein n=1 Tax=Clostridium pasteurianum BC1 TaxID=86416 RepID=R4K040_CLOPA|nr:YibE/F family protein [Clostridium pasteurianum]AGK95136.1 putative multitransmembrane protein [Clostridium pasteurianum BC1]